jgi:hypothetical protein
LEAAKVFDMLLAVPKVGSVKATFDLGRSPTLRADGDPRAY